ncbi:MAG TPA: FecR family protein [Bacteroidota bacterium]
MRAHKHIAWVLFFVLFVLAVGGLSVAQPESSLALVSKIIQRVLRQQDGKDWVDAKRGETLGAGDKIRTGQSSLAVIKFKDNSMLRVRELSELTIEGVNNNGVFFKSVEIEKGAVGFNIRKQGEGEEFRFSSPTSVASIRGTGGQFLLADSADLLVVIEGVVLYTNQISRESVEVRAGFTGVSRKDGTIVTRPSTDEEQREAIESSRQTDRENEFEFDLRDNQGNRRKLRIEFK